MNNKTEVIYSPEGDGANSYVKINKNIINNLNDFFVNDNITLRKFFNFSFFFKRRFKNTVVVVNWLENLLRSRTGRVSFYGTFKYFFVLSLIKIHGAKLVYIRHNFYPHGMVTSSAKLTEKIIGMGQFFSDKKASLSPHLICSGYQYLPHPLYNTKLPDQCFSKKSTYYVIFGRIERYKNIERIINVWSSTAGLIIAGSSNNSGYLSEIRKLSEGKNIRIIAKSLSDSEAEELIRGAAGLIVFHSNPNTIVSGSFFFGVSCGAYILALKTDFLEFIYEHNQYEGLIVVSSIEELNCAISELSQLENKLSPEELYEQASINFGFSVVADSWTKLLTF